MIYENIDHKSLEMQTSNYLKETDINFIFRKNKGIRKFLNEVEFKQYFNV